MPTQLGVKPSFKLRYTLKQPVYKQRGTLSKGLNANRGLLSDLRTKSNGYRPRSPNLNNMSLSELISVANNNNRKRTGLKSLAARRFIDPSMFQNTKLNSAGGKKRTMKLRR